MRTGEEDDLGDSGNRTCLLNPESEDEEELEDDLTGILDIIERSQQDNVDDSDVEEVTLYEDDRTESPCPSLCPSSDSEEENEGIDSDNDEPADMERMFDDMTVNDGDKEKLSTVTENTNVDEEINQLWQRWSTDEDSDIFTVADLLEKTPSNLCGTKIPEHVEQDGTPEPLR